MKLVLATIFTAVVLVGAAFSQTTSFNYQGKLVDAGAPANGSYQFTFKLYDAPNGSQVGPTIADMTLEVVDGSFSASLDFGAAAFAGADRYLEISIRKLPADPYTAMLPRQKINSVPYATRAARATDADAIGGQTATDISTAITAVNGATSANTPNTIAKRDANGQVIVGSLKFQDGSSMTTAPSMANILGSQNTWTGQNTFTNGLSVNNANIANVANPVSANDAANKTYVDSTTIRFVPGAEQLSVGDANGSAPMINLRGGSAMGPGQHMPAWFKVFQNGSFVATGNIGTGVSPMQGAGHRTSWDSNKSAFRSGYAETQWDDGKVGQFSWAGGMNSTASGAYSFAFGDSNLAENTASIAIGMGNHVNGYAGFTAGAANRVCGVYGVAFGSGAQSGGPMVNGRCGPDMLTNTGRAAVAIGENVIADKNYTVAMGRYTSNNGFFGTFIWGDGSATSAADTFKNITSFEFAVRATGGFRFRTNLAGTTGCNLPAGSGVFACTSSKYTKENFVSANGVLASLRKVPVTSWNYISEGRSVRHLGPMAEDFFAQFGLGTGNTSIGVQDLAGVSIAAVKELDAQLQQKNAEIERLQNEVTTLRSNQVELEKRLQAIEHALVKQN